jgi:hypothetical protein
MRQPTLAETTGMRSLSIMGSLLTAVGVAISCLNFYLSVVRYPLHRWRGKPRSEFRWISGFPLLGSLGVVVGLVLMKLSSGLPPTLVVALALAIAVLDTGGLHWFVGSQVWRHFERRRRALPGK